MGSDGVAIQSIIDECCDRIKVVDKSAVKKAWWKQTIPERPYGTYRMTGNLVNGKNQYVKEDDENVVIWYDGSPKKQWLISRKYRMDDNNPGGWGSIRNPSRCANINGSNWRRYYAPTQGGNGWEPAGNSIVVECV